MVESSKTRHYLIVRASLPLVHFGQHRSALINRPTPWKTFFLSFLGPRKYAFALMDDEELERFLSGRYASFSDGRTLKSNGDNIIIEEWSLWNVCLFCLEGIRYGTFQRFWNWTWTKKEN